MSVVTTSTWPDFTQTVEPLNALLLYPRVPQFEVNNRCFFD